MHDRFAYRTRFSFNEEESAAQHEAYHRRREELEKKIISERAELTTWLSTEANKSKTYYPLVVEICDHFEPEEDEHHYHPLDFFQARVDDLRAIHKALKEGNTDELMVRTEACMTSKSKSMQALGILMLALALALFVAAVCILNIVSPVLIFLGAVATLAAYFAYDYGVTKIHTDKSGLFARFGAEIIKSSSVIQPVAEKVMPVADIVESHAMHI